MTYYKDNYTNFYNYETSFEDDYNENDNDNMSIYTCNDSISNFQMNMLISKKNEAELVSLMILGFFIMFNVLLYKSINKIISVQRERLVKYKRISEYYINQYGIPFTCPIEPSKYVDNTDIILKHIIENEANEYNGEFCFGSSDSCDDNNNDENYNSASLSDRVLPSKKQSSNNKSLDINGDGWKLD
jgi:hypothetical protein